MLILIGSFILAWLFYRYGYNSKKMVAARAWKQRFKQLRERVITLTKETNGDIEQRLFQDLHDAHMKFISEAYQAIDDASFFWIKSIYYRLIDEANETVRIWNKHIDPTYSDKTNT